MSPSDGSKQLKYEASAGWTTYGTFLGGVMNMKRPLIAMIVFFAGSFINAGTAPLQETIDREVISRIRDEGLNRSQAMETFTHFTEVIGPRLTATPAYKS